MLKVGDKVKIAKKSEHYGCSQLNNPKCEGIVLNTKHGGFPIYVDWDNGTKNDYRYQDLKLVKHDRPTRYKSREVNGMDVIDLVEHWGLDFPEANILKYLLRNKGEDLQDMEKIKDYADRKIKQLNK